MKNEIPIKILEVLNNLYDQKPTAVLSTNELANILKIPVNEAQGALIYLKEKDLINSYQRYDEWVQKISAFGIDELQRIQSNSTESASQTHSDYLDLDVEEDNFQGIMHVFVSHKFVNEDQKLALSLKRRLRKNNIEGYLAEQKREFDIPINQKIRDKINESDYLIAIITKFSLKSPSVHQEIGYALGSGCPIRIMVETEEVPGVLVKDREVEEFTRTNFEKKLDIIINNIIDKGPRKKIKSEGLQQLIQNVYEPCYNQMMNVYTAREFITDVPPNPWKTAVSSMWKLKTETEIKDLFEEYSKELDVYRQMFVEIETDFFYQKKHIADSVSVAFKQAGLIDKNNSIILDERSTMEPKDWVHKFRYVLFDPANTNATKLHQRLVEFAKLTDDAHERWLERISARTDLFRYLATILPSIREEFHTNISYTELELEREKLKITIEQLILALEERLK